MPTPSKAPTTAARLLPALLFLASTPALAAPQGEAPLAAADRKALESFKLTTALLERAAVFHERAAEKLRRDPKAKAAALEGLGGETITETVRRMESSPLLVAALEEARLSARDYLLTSLVSITTAMVLALQEGAPRTAALPEGTSARNLAFLEKDGAAAFERFQRTSALLLAAQEKRKPQRRDEAPGEEPAAGPPP